MKPHKLPHPSALSRALSRALSSTAATAPPQCGSPFPLKTVTTANFEPSLAELRRYVRTSDFVAIDLEMTGVTSAPWRDSFEFDRADVRYLKIRDSASKFAVVQFGVCPFRWDPSNQSFIAYPHNFYVFPRQELAGLGPCDEFLCQTTSMDFLARYQFDFNACINEGISYLSRDQEREALRTLNSTYGSEWSDICKLKDVRDIPLVSMADILFSARMKNKFSEWRDGLLHEQNLENQFHGISEDSKLQVIFFKMHPALKLNGFTSHQLKVIQLVIRKHFKDLLYVSANSEASGSQHIVVYTDLKDELNLLMEVKEGNHRAAEKKIQAAVGFRHVIDLLTSEQKLIVGHNSFLDIAHVYSKFIGPLPGTLEEFVASVNKFFPHIVDTKILMNTNCMLQERMKKSRKSLASAFTLLCPQIADGFTNTDLCSLSNVNVDIEVDDLRSSNWKPGGKHEAGYDAFMTGCIFAQICSDLGIDFKLHECSKQLALNEKLRNYVNHLYLSWMHGDIIDLSTGSKVADSTPSYSLKRRYPKILFENIVIIWGFPSKMKASKIRGCISKAFGPTSVVSVYHLDATAVFVQFSKTELVTDFLLVKDTLERSDGAIQVLHPLAKLLEGCTTCAANYDTYKEICGSPLSENLFADQAKSIGIKWKTKLIEYKVALASEEQGPSVQGIVNTAIKNAEKAIPNTINQLRNAQSRGQVSSFEIEDSSTVAEANL
ncbi:hypothetical protein RJT34_13159 [Clitoria ternatea]|uniref:Uncharacterized protein n=1 Tax=Clitoria ternatea TaxID=43366 RepID=A0AAN9JRL1_CLITE